MPRLNQIIDWRRLTVRVATLLILFHQACTHIHFPECPPNQWPEVIREAVARGDLDWPSYWAATHKEVLAGTGSIPTPLEPADLERVGKERIRSKSYGWELKIPYGPSRYFFEGEQTYLIEAIHDLGDGYSVFTPFAESFYLIDKKNGQVLRRLEFSLTEGGSPTLWLQGKSMYFLSPRSRKGPELAVRCLQLE